MLNIINRVRCANYRPLVQLIAGIKDFPDPPKIEVLGFPESNRPKLLTKIPQYPGYMRAPKMSRRLANMRGPELVHNKLIHKQYGIMALSGGHLKWGHYEMMRQILNRNLDRTKQFAVWRVDGPHRPKTKRSPGKKLGGGQGDIEFYITPVKSGRIIIEVGGLCEYEYVERTLIQIARLLPFPAKAVSQQVLDEWVKQDEELRLNNLNNLKWEWCVKNNILNCINYMGKYDLEYAHLGPDAR